MTVAKRMSPQPKPDATAATTWPTPQVIRIFVHLAYGFDEAVWHARWTSHALLGLNERSPYGYHRAAALGCDVTFSQDRPEGLIGRAVRGTLRLVLGFDLVHAFRNRRRMLASEVVWTHTESQHLAALALFRLLRIARPPRVIAQSVWLIDSWRYLPVWKRWLYRRLLDRADVLTFLSPLNLAVAQSLFPALRCEFVPFGIDATLQDSPTGAVPRTPLRVLALGNDRHRDWPTLIAALGGDPRVEIRIASGTIERGLTAAHANITIETPTRNDALKALYRWADVVVLPLKENLHASGITVLQEAVLFGRPVICTRAGGIDAYFPSEEVMYCEPGDVATLRAAVHALIVDGESARARATQAQGRMSAAGLSSEAYVRRHVELSRELVPATAPSSQAHAGG